MAADLEFRLLGPLEVVADGQIVHILGPRQRVVLAMLLLEHGRVLPVDRLIDAVWDDKPPATARSQIQISISELRRRLGSAGGAELIVTNPAGYLLQADDHSLDLARFRRLVASGREAVSRQDLPRGTAELREALSYWRGDAAAGIKSPLVEAIAVRLNEERLAVTEECIGIELVLGRHPAMIGELRALLAEQPFREKLYAHLMVALYRSGQQAEALAVYRRAHQLLVEEYGIDPGDELRALERAVLNSDPTLEPPSTELERIAPRQLPAAPPGFVGRNHEVAQIRQRLAPAGTSQPAGTIEVLVVSGRGGVGKTSLALHAAHAVREGFPDGQLFAHLRGTDAHPVHPDEVLSKFLRALGVPPALLPTEPDELAALYRSRLADRRILVVLDDAASADQVRPLMPGDPHCAMLVTSRGALPGLHGSLRIDIGELEPASSIALLSHVIGEPRVQAESQATAALAETCGHLPLALRIAAAKLSVRRHWSITRMVDRLADERKRLDELTLDGASVRASISMSYQGLDRPARRLLSLLGTLGATDFAFWVAGPLLDTSAEDGADALDGLAEMRLVDVTVDPRGRTRYRLHDLIRIFVQETLTRDVPAAARAEAQHRLLRCWLFLAREAHRREQGGEFTVLRSDCQPWPLPLDLIDELMIDPIEWFQSERDNLISAVGLAEKLNLVEVCWELSMTSVTLFESQADREAWRETHEIALAAARRVGNLRAEAAMQYSRASLAIVEQRLSDAEQDLEPALAWFTQASDAHGRGLALRHLAFIDRLRGSYGAAQDRYAAALSELRSVGDEVGEAHILSSLAQIHMDRDQPSHAERLLHDALAICHRVGARRVAAQVQHRMGQLYLLQHELERAETTFTEVLGVVARFNDPIGMAYALLGIGDVQLAKGEFTSATVTLREALDIVRRTGHRLATARALFALAEALLSTGDTSAAACHLAEADALFIEIGVEAWQKQVHQLRERLRTQRGA